MKKFVNADEIAKGLSPFNPEGVAIEAGRLMLKIGIGCFWRKSDTNKNKKL